LAAILLALAAILLPTSLLVLPRIGLHSQDHQFAKSAYPPRARARPKSKVALTLSGERHSRVLIQIIT
jgi:hypothetical protein